MTNLFFILLCGCCDMIRGGITKNEFLEQTAKWTYGCWLALFITDNPYLIIVSGILWNLGERPGWGFPSGWIITGKDPRTWKEGAVPEKFQVLLGIEERPLLSLFVRGAIWAGLLLPLMYFELGFGFIFLSATVMFPLAAVIGSRVTWQQGHVHEFLRGVLIAGGVFVCTLLT